MNTTKDGFVWKLVNDKAKEIFNSGLFELYELHDNDAESLIETFEELNTALDNGSDIGIEVGFLEQKTEYDRGTMRKKFIELEKEISNKIWEIMEQYPQIIFTTEETIEDDEPDLEIFEMRNDITGGVFDVYITKIDGNGMEAVEVNDFSEVHRNLDIYDLASIEDRLNLLDVLQEKVNEFKNAK